MIKQEDMDNIIKAALDSKEGRMQLAMKMAAPIRRNLDYQGIARSAFFQNKYEVYDWDFYE